METSTPSPAPTDSPDSAAGDASAERIARGVEALEGAVAAWRERDLPAVDAILVSGSGLAVDLPGRVHDPEPLADLLPFPVRGIAGHPLSWELLEPVEGRRVLYFRGRVHSYQGHDAFDTVFSVRLGALLGARALVMTNAAGGLHASMAAGDLVLVTDHLNLTGLNPLRGELPDGWGPRFPDMGAAYDPALRRRARHHADALGIRLAEGVYAGVAGPSYETPAEVRMLRTLGADLVGMSTVLEVIAARHLRQGRDDGLRCLVLSLVSNLGAGVTPAPLDHDEVTRAGAAAAEKVQGLLAALLGDPELLDEG